MSSIKPLEQIAEDEKTLRLLEMVGGYFRYAEDTRIELDKLTVMLRDIILEPYRFGGRFIDADYALVRKLDSVLLGWATKEDLVEFIKNRGDKQD